VGGTVCYVAKGTTPGTNSVGTQAKAFQETAGYISLPLMSGGKNTGSERVPGRVKGSRT